MNRPHMKAMTPPKPKEMAEAKPTAAPVSSLFTEIAILLAFGSVTPLPKPVKNPARAIGVMPPKSGTANKRLRIIPAKTRTRPVTILDPRLFVFERLPDMKLPTKKPSGAAEITIPVKMLLEIASIRRTAVTCPRYTYNAPRQKSTSLTFSDYMRSYVKLLTSLKYLFSVCSLT